MLTFQIFSDRQLRRELADYTDRVQPPFGGGLTIGTNHHGKAALNAPLIPMSLDEAFEVFAWPGTPHAVVSDNGLIVWQGRVEDKTMRQGGIRLGAYGQWRAMSDRLYTGLWSVTGSGGWRPATRDEVATAEPSRYSLDNNNRVYIGLQLGRMYDDDHQGALAYQLPHRSRELARRVRFAWQAGNSTGVNYRAVVAGWSEAWTLIDSETVYLDDNDDSGTFDYTFSAGVNFVTISFGRDSATAHEYTGEDGETFFRATQLRITSVTGEVRAEDIAAALAAFVRERNPGQLDDKRALLRPLGVDLTDEVYEDLHPADILNDLAARFGYEVGVAGGQLYFRPEGSVGRDYLVEARALRLESSVEEALNEMYGRYRDAGGRIMRTETAVTQESLDRLELVRTGMTLSNTTSESQAEIERDARLQSRARRAARAQIDFDRIETAQGARARLYDVKSGDRIRLVNLPPLGRDIGISSVVRVAATEYDCVTDRLIIEPAAPAPTLVSALSEQAARVRALESRR